jgi:hypothetical protein
MTSLVVVHDLDILRTGSRPAEADAILVIHPDAVLAHAIAPERFEAVARRHTEVVEHGRNLALPELSSRNRLDVDETLHPNSTGESFGVRILE